MEKKGTDRLIRSCMSGMYSSMCWNPYEMSATELIITKYCSLMFTIFNIWDRSSRVSERNCLTCSEDSI